MNAECEAHKGKKELRLDRAAETHTPAASLTITDINVVGDFQ